MHKTNSLLMHAPKMDIFETAANLELWPKILPHYRYIQFLERGPDRNIVVMAARRSGIPISWTSEQIIDRDKLEIGLEFLRYTQWRAGNDFTRFAIPHSRTRADCRCDHRRFFYF